MTITISKDQDPTEKIGSLADTAEGRGTIVAYGEATACYAVEIGSSTWWLDPSEVTIVDLTAQEQLVELGEQPEPQPEPDES